MTALVQRGLFDEHDDKGCVYSHHAHDSEWAAVRLDEAKFTLKIKREDDLLDIHTLVLEQMPELCDDKFIKLLHFIANGEHDLNIYPLASIIMACTSK